MDQPAVRLTRSWSALAGIAAIVVAIPVLFTGPGTDLDTGAVFESGRAILDGDYHASRAPGSPVHETAVGVLDAVGGPVLTNLASMLMAIALVVGLVVLLRRETVPHAELAAAFVIANPWFQIAATSTVDFVWSIALVVFGALTLRSSTGADSMGTDSAGTDSMGTDSAGTDSMGTEGRADRWSSTRPLLAGLLFGLAIGTRMSAAVVVATALAADLLAGRDRRRPVVIAGLTAALTSVVLFLPPFFAAGSSLAFAENDFATSTPLNHLGRAAAKNFAFFGPYACVAIALALPVVVRALPAWRTSWALRFGLLGFVLSQALFLRFPWKMGHLIPALVCLAMVLAIALARRPAFFVLIVAAQLLYSVVNVEFFQPDSPNDADGATFEMRVRWGPSIVDTQCRRQDPDAYVDNNHDLIEVVWNCAKPWGDGP